MGCRKTPKKAASNIGYCLTNGTKCKVTVDGTEKEGVCRTTSIVGGAKRVQECYSIQHPAYSN
jgi:hypothetical protein